MRVMHLPGRPARYTSVARWYDLVSAEPVYVRGRRLAIPLLRLSPGDTVLDIGCGTGLNFALLSEAVGPAGRIVGVDSSAEMLAQARRRPSRRSGPEIILCRGDATSLEPDELVQMVGRPVDAVLATYSLSLMSNWRRGFRLAYEVTRPLGRIAVVDMQRPTSRLARPLAAIAMAAGGADPAARPWVGVEETCTDVASPTAAGAHVQVRVGTRPVLA